MRSEGFRTDINGLRGVSVALVVAYHLQVKGAFGGFIGVDVFFVISGYLMTHIVWRGLAEDRFSIWRFVVARAARIWPALAAMLIVLFALGCIWLPPFDMRTLAAQGAWTLPLLSNRYFQAHSGYATENADDLWLLHTWSLSIEWQFYLLFPLLLMAADAVRRRCAPARPEAGLWIAVVIALLFAASLSFGLQWLLRSTDPNASFFLLSARAWELLAGGLVFLAARHSHMVDSRWRVAAGYAGLGLVMLSALVIALLRQRPVGMGGYMLAPVAGVALVLWADDQRNRILGHPVLQALGRWSYSIYLWHWPIIVALWMTTWPVDLPRVTMLTVATASILVGWLSYRYIERPCSASRDWSIWRMARRPTLVMTVAGAATLAVAASDGLAWRASGGDTEYQRHEAETRLLQFPEHCSNFMKSASGFEICPIERGDGAHRVLVIGDSHAEHLWPWFVRHSEVSVDFFPASECPPVPRFQRLQAGFHCQEYAEIAWRKAVSPVYDTVILSARWATVGLFGPPYCHQASDGQCVLVTGTQKQALLLAELRAAIVRILRAGKVVVVLDGAPEAPFRVPKRLAREAFWYGNAQLTVDANSLLAQTAWIDGLFKELAVEPGFHLVTVRDKLCTESTCRVYDRTLKRPVYRDESHFDSVWIAENASFFAPFVTAR